MTEPAQNQENTQGTIPDVPQSPSIPESPAFTAANVAASLVNTLWQGEEMPTVSARLSPVIDLQTGSEAVPSAYVVPVDFGMARASRASYSDTLVIAFILCMETLDEAAAQAALARMHQAVRHLLDTGEYYGVKFIDAQYAELFDYDLLANARIFRSQANISCKVFEL